MSADAGDIRRAAVLDLSEIWGHSDGTVGTASAADLTSLRGWRHYTRLREKGFNRAISLQ